MEYKRMIAEEPCEEEDGLDPISVYIIFDDSSESDQIVISALCRDIDNWGIAFTNLKPNTESRKLDVKERVKLISSATWVIVLCSGVQALAGDNVFAYEENQALFEAMKKCKQNIVYLLTEDVHPFPSKGFHHVAVSSSTNWSITLKSFIQTRPIAIDARVFSEFYSQLTLSETGWYASLPDTLSRPSRNNNKISWILKGRDCQGSSQYVFQLCGDSVMLESKGEEALRSVDVPVSFSTLEDKMDKDTDDTGDGWCGCGCFIFMNIFMYGYIAMSVFASSPVAVGYSEDIRSTYIPGLQVAHMVVSLLLSLLQILCSTLEISKELRIITTYHSIFTTVCLILQVLYFVDNLPHHLDVLVGGGVLCFCVYSNNLTVINYFGSNAKNSKCMFTLRAIGFLIGVSLFIRFCILSPMMFKLSKFSFKTTLIVLSILFICEMGFFRVLVGYIRDLVRLIVRKPLGNISEMILLLVFMALWFGPTFFVY